MTDNDLRAMRTEAVEDFLKTVYLLQREVDPVPTMLLAQALDIQAPSVTDMIKRLSGVEDKKPRKDKEREREPDPADKTSEKTPDKTGKLPTPLLYYEPYRGVRLTEAGEKIALEVIRHHRLIELYLSQALGYSWDQVHEEAERLEHVISEQLESRIAEVLGFPELDPHGDPIPALDGTIPDRPLRLLSDMEATSSGTVSRIVNQAPEVLRYLSDLGLIPGIPVTITEQSPLHDTVTIRIGDHAAAKTISTQVARNVLVM